MWPAAEASNTTVVRTNHCFIMLISLLRLQGLSRVPSSYQSEGSVYSLNVREPLRYRSDHRLGESRSLPHREIRDDEREMTGRRKRGDLHRTVDWQYFR